jgi:DNA (cytosine-5)-methyltransferase 1
VRAAVEIDSRAVETYRRNHRSTTLLHGDIRHVTASDLRRAARLTGPLDLLAGCPPCQGYSRVRRRNRNSAVEDPRNSLVEVFGRLVTELEPKTVMMENVPGLEQDRQFGTLIGLLRRHGYRYDWRIVDAADYGVPQRRRRLVVLAARGRRRPLIDEVPTVKEPPTVKDTIGRLPSPEKSRKAAHRLAPMHTSEVVARLAKIPKDGGSRGDLSEEEQLGCHKRVDGFRDIYGRLAWNTVAPTITGGCVNPSKGRFVHPVEDRGLTPYEAALLQSFPPNYVFLRKHGRMHNADMIGNALPPRLAEVFARYLLQNFLV